MSTMAQTSLETSLAVRICTAFMACLIITCACSYIQLNPAVTCIYLWLAFIGSYASYVYKDKRPFWLPIIPFGGAILILGTFIFQSSVMFLSGHLNLLSPLVQVLAGLQAVHCFDLKTRQEFAVSTLIGIGLLTCSACLTTSIVFVFWLISYMLLLSFLLYFVSVSQTKTLGPTNSANLQSARPGALSQDHSNEYRKAVSVVVLTPILLLPVLSILVFFYFPRSDSVLSWITKNFVAPYVATVPGLGGSTSGQFSHPNSSAASGSGVKRVVTGPGNTGTTTVATAGNESPSNSSSANATASGASGSDGSSGSNYNSGSGTGSGASGNSSASASGSPATGGAPGGAGSKGGSKESSSQVQGIEEAKNISATMDQQVQSYNPSQAPPGKADLEEVIFKVSASRPGYTRRLTYDTYDGAGWSRQGPVPGITFKEENNGWFDVGNANSLLLAPECQTVEVKQEITISSKSIGDLLPTYWVPEAVSGGFSQITAQADGSLRSDKELKDGFSYTVISHLPIYKIDSMRHLVRRSQSYFEGASAAEMRRAEDVLLKKYTQLPDDFPAEVSNLAKKVAGNDGNWFVQAERISEYLHKNCKYQNSDLQRMKKGDFVYNFLFRTREGNCVDFSAAFVTMCRSIGIPARMVGGYLPGTLNKTTGFFEVRLKDGHAWGEIYLPNWSWVPFDPTPNPNSRATYPETDKQTSSAFNFMSALANSDLVKSINSKSKQANANGAGLGAGIKGSKLDKPAKNTQPKSQPAKKTDGKNLFDFFKNTENLNLLAQIGEIFALVSWAGIAAFLAFLSVLVLFIYFIKKLRSRIPFATEGVNKPSSQIYLQVIEWLKPYDVQRMPSDTPLNVLAKAELAFAQIETASPELKGLLFEFTSIYCLDRFGDSDHRAELEGLSKKIRALLPPVPQGDKRNR